MGEVVVADFKSAYPSMIVAFNVSREGGDSGIVVGMMKQFLKERTRASSAAIQENAKLAANSLVGVFAMQACELTDVDQANAVYAHAKRCLQLVVDTITNEFATCATCACTHRFSREIVNCQNPIRAESLKILEMITDSVVFMLSPSDPVGVGADIVNQVQQTCFGNLPPIQLEVSEAVIELIGTVYAGPKHPQHLHVRQRPVDICTTDARLRRV
jgi:DNA polymerase elongation subunit (family B)